MQPSLTACPGCAHASGCFGPSRPATRPSLHCCLHLKKRLTRSRTPGGGLQGIRSDGGLSRMCQVSVAGRTCVHQWLCCSPQRQGLTCSPAAMQVPDSSGLPARYELAQREAEARPAAPAWTSSDLPLPGRSRGQTSHSSRDLSGMAPRPAPACSLHMWRGQQAPLTAKHPTCMPCNIKTSGCFHGCMHDQRGRVYCIGQPRGSTVSGMW